MEARFLVVYDQCNNRVTQSGFFHDYCVSYLATWKYIHFHILILISRY